MENTDREEPFRKNKTKILAYEVIKDHVFRMSKKIFSKSPTINTDRISLSEKKSNFLMEGGKKVNILEKILKTSHQINKKRIQIIKLPKMPFGCHENYNNEEVFVTNHFIPTENPDRTKELDQIIKKFRLFDKQYNKTRNNSLEFIENPMKKFKILTFKTKAGVLICKPNKSVISTYDRLSSHLQKTRNLSVPTPEIPIIKLKKPSLSQIKNTITRLYPTPEPSTSRLLSSISSKYTILFPDLNLKKK